jgi:elongation factor G
MEAACLESIRNVAIVSSAGAGKTSLGEALLYTGGAIPSLGSVTQAPFDKYQSPSVRMESHQHQSH